MYTENDFMTPRERINETLLRRVLDDSSAQHAQYREPSCTNNNEYSDRRPARKTWGLEEYPLASVFAPLQQWRNVYDLESGFGRGTIFKELDLPFLCGDRKGGNCCGR